MHWTRILLLALLQAAAAAQQSRPLVGIANVVAKGETVQLVKEGFAYTEAVVLEARTPPVVRLDKVAGLDLDPDLVSENVGVLHFATHGYLDDQNGLSSGLLIAPTVTGYNWITVPPAAADQVATISSSVQIGTAFMREYLLPFEIASVLLLVALIGAIVIAYEERSARRKVLTLAEEVALRQPPRGEPLHSAPVAVAASSPEAPSQP
jgi:hypothetical protein